MRRKAETTDVKCSGKGRYSASREDIPSSIEQETARDYCCSRALHRPHTTVKTALKWLLIVAIELYQHYAPESVRRKCILMPTCSEYAILALRKYGVIVGLCKIYIRLVKTCRGNVYRMDYP